MVIQIKIKEMEEHYTKTKIQFLKVCFEMQNILLRGASRSEIAEYLVSGGTVYPAFRIEHLAQSVSGASIF